MSIQRLVTWITFLAIFAMAAKVSVDSDTWWHLRAGQWIVENGTIPQNDVFSYTRSGADWRYPGWLVEVPMALIYRAAGPGGLNLWTAAMVTLAFIFLWQALSGGVFLRAFVTILAAAASGVYWAARPHLVTFLLAAVIIWLLERYRWSEPGDRGASARLWWLPVLMVLWANSHGGFIVGFILLGTYLFSNLVDWLTNKLTADRRRLTQIGKLELENIRVHQRPTSCRQSAVKIIHLCLIGLAMLLAVCLNPSGPGMLLYPFKTVSIGALGTYIQEWLPPDFHLRSVQPFIWLLLLTFGAVGISRRRLALSDFLLAAGFAYLSFMAARNIALFALAAPVVLTRHAEPIADTFARRFGLRSGAGPTSPLLTRLNRILLAVVVLAAIVKAGAALPLEANLAEIRKTMPVEAVNFIKSTRPPGKLFNSYNWGGYLLWELPGYPVFIDGRTDLYDDELVNEWLRVVRAEEGWEEVLDRWEVRLVLLEPGMPVVRLLEEDNWELVYEDEVAVMYGR
jgi:hypothetical protein